MLVLSRKPGERVIIKSSDGDICVQVLAVSGSGVRLAFHAPESVPIHREEARVKLPPGQSRVAIE